MERILAFKTMLVNSFFCGGFQKQTHLDEPSKEKDSVIESFNLMKKILWSSELVETYRQKTSPLKINTHFLLTCCPIWNLEKRKNSDYAGLKTPLRQG